MSMRIAYEWHNPFIIVLDIQNTLQGSEVLNLLKEKSTIFATVSFVSSFNSTGINKVYNKKPSSTVFSNSLKLFHIWRYGMNKQKLMIILLRYKIRYF